MTHRVAIADAELNVEEHGAGVPVLLVSGLGGRLAFWRPVVPAFAKNFRIVLHDHRGTGDSTKSKIDYSVRQMADDVLALMDAKKIEKAHLVGHSTGGAIAQRLALDHPDRVDKIVLSASWAGPDAYFKALFDLRLKILTDIGPAAYLSDGILRAFPPAWLQAHPELITATEAERLAAFPGIEIEASRIAAVQRHDLRERISMISRKTLVICAADDAITPLPMSQELAAKIPGAMLAVLPMGGHFMPHVDPERYARLVLAFLTGQETPHA
ncbi:MAG: alpha/beta fold hydrolase [Rhodobacteraceae bacterium]|nr:alpha/beta fold hydrolase [Paracoccaceae bacterium]